MEPSFGPVSIFYCWQSLALSTAVWALTRIAKEALLLLSGDNKKALLWVRNVVLPLFPILLGMLLVFVAPILPADLVRYAENQALLNKDPELDWTYYLAYGAIVGQFSSYLHDRVAGLLEMKGIKGLPSQDDDKTPVDKQLP